MNCKESQQRISEIVWQSHSSLTDLGLSTHLSGCEKCRLFYDRYSKGVAGIMTDKRVLVDARLFDSVISRVNINNANASGVVMMRPVFKIAYSAIISAAAIFIGIMIGQAYLDKTTIESETYSQEIASLNDDNSVVNAKIIEYYESDNAE